MPEPDIQSKLSRAEVTAIGIGGMVGGGIFAVLGRPSPSPVTPFP